MKSIITNILVIILTTNIVLCQDSISLTKKIDDYVEPYLAMQAWSGVISIYKDGQPFFEKAYGKADRELEVNNTIDTRFRIASLSKIFTEAAILKLADESKLMLTDELSDFIPDYPRGNEITISHLINHSSGIPNLNDFEDYDDLTKFNHTLPEVIEFFKNKPLEFEPGTDVEYSNSGYVLLAYIIEKASGISFNNYLEKAIFQPNELNDTGVDDPSIIIKDRAKGYTFNELAEPVNADFVNMSIKIGGGSLYSSTNDLNRFMIMLVNDQIVSDFVNKTSFIDTKDSGEKIIVLDGRISGFCHRLVYDLKTNICTTILGNNYAKIAMSISDDVQKIYRNEPYNLPVDYLSNSLPVDELELKLYEGVYDFGFGPQRNIKVIEGNLTYQSGESGTPDKLVPIGEDTFFYLRYWTLVKFRKENSSAFNKIDWIMGDNVWSGNKITDN